MQAGKAIAGENSPWHERLLITLRIYLKRGLRGSSQAASWQRDFATGITNSINGSPKAFLTVVLLG
jgi:hypothetical protein